MAGKGRNLANGPEQTTNRCPTINEPLVGPMVVDTAFLYMFYSPARTRKVIRFWKTTKSDSTTI